MKSAEQLENDNLVLIGRLSYCAETQDWKRFELLLKQHSEQIQQDAWQGGMRDAAEIANDYNGRLPNHPDNAQWYVKSCNESRQAILTAANKP